MLRPATPLSILFFAAFILLLLSTLSTPIIKAIPLATFENVDLGVFGYCQQNQCSGLHVGYNTGMSISRCYPCCVSGSSIRSILGVQLNSMVHQCETLLIRRLLASSNTDCSPHSRWGLFHCRKLRLLSPFRNSTLALFHSYRSPHRCPPDSRLLRFICCRPFPLPCPLSTVPPWTPDPQHSDSTHLSACILSRPSTFRSSSELGRMDCTGRHNSCCGKRCRYVCDETDSGISKSPEEADSRKCRNER